MCPAVSDSFSLRKSSALQRLAREGHDPDPTLSRILRAVNSRPDLYTTSSCSGRVAVMEMPRAGAKGAARFLGKWHRPARVEEVRAALERHKRGEAWLFFQGPILHIAARDVESAARVLRLAQGAGFKRSGIVSVTPTGCVVEILGTERMDILVPPHPDPEVLQLWVREGNRMLGRTRVRWKSLCRALEQL